MSKYAMIYLQLISRPSGQKNPDAFSNKQRLKSKIAMKFLIPSLDKPYHCERCKESGLIS